MLAGLLALAGPVCAQASGPDPEQLIAHLRVNETERGEGVLLRQPDGDWWISAADADKLHVPLLEAAARTWRSERFFSLRALGALSTDLQESTLSLAIVFPAALLPGSRIDLARRPPPVPKPEERLSLLLSYRMSVRPEAGNSGSKGTAVDVQSDLNVRTGNLLLRQEVRLAHDPGSPLHGTRRGATQALWDDLEHGTRLAVGDTVSTAGAFGTGITGAGVSYSRLFQLTPDVIRQPTASFTANGTLPSEVEVSVDGTTLYRGRLPPGQVALDNLLLYGGVRTVRFTVTDSSGRRETYEQPFFFTDAVLAAGLHEFNYFAGRRSSLDTSSRIRYLEPAWQAFHRYGLSDSVTLSAGGEGSREFSNAGAGAAWRSDVAGLVAGELTTSRDHETGRQSQGWAGRYTYQLLGSSLQLSRRAYQRGYRTFGTGPSSPFLRDETAASLSWRLLGGVWSVGGSRQRDDLDRRDTSFLRYTASVSRGTTIVAELLQNKTSTGSQWSANVFLRLNFDAYRWASASAAFTRGARTTEVAMGQQLPSSEGFGYRLGTAHAASAAGDSVSALGSASWNTRSATFDVFARSGTAGAPRSLEGVVSGALVATGGWAGLTRPVSDGFAVARLGVPQPGVRVYLENQLQGRTDDNGALLIPNIGSYGLQTLSFEDQDLPMQYTLPEKRKSFSLGYRGGALIDFGGSVQQGFAGPAWLLQGGGRTRLSARQVLLQGPGGTITVDVSRGGDFYLERVKPGRYRGAVDINGKRVACRLEVVLGADPVSMSEEGMLCE